MTDFHANREGRPDPAALARLRASRVREWLSQARAALRSSERPERDRPADEERRSS